jgi:hypothetical protein
MAAAHCEEDFIASLDAQVAASRCPRMLKEILADDCFLTNVYGFDRLET